MQSCAPLKGEKELKENLDESWELWKGDKEENGNTPKAGNQGATDTDDKADLAGVLAGDDNTSFVASFRRSGLQAHGRTSTSLPVPSPTLSREGF